jgi:hypothetical protein
LVAPDEDFFDPEPFFLDINAPFGRQTLGRPGTVEENLSLSDQE